MLALSRHAHLKYGPDGLREISCWPGPRCLFLRRTGPLCNLPKIAGDECFGNDDQARLAIESSVSVDDEHVVL
jgi:hypothetical protein